MDARLKHFLIYHLLPFTALCIAFFGLIVLLVAGYKSKKRNAKLGLNKKKKRVGIILPKGDKRQRR